MNPISTRKPLSPQRLITGLASLLALTLAHPVLAAITWSGASGTDTNWSNGGNWGGGTAPSGGDDVKFFNAGTNGVAGTANNQVDGSFAGYIGSLQYGNTNGFHTTSIAAGQTLNITNTGGLQVGTSGDVNFGVATANVKGVTNWATITGAGAALVLSNSAANLVVNAGSISNATVRATLDLSGLDTFTATVNRIGLGTITLPNPGNSLQRAQGILYLAKTNVITLNYTDTLANYQTSGKTNALELSHNPGNNAGTPSILYLGQNNVINVDSLGIGMDKSGNNSTPASGVIAFNTAYAGQNPTAVFYGSGGSGTRVTWWSDGDGNASASSSNGGSGTNDFSLGTINALVNVMSLARDASSASDTWAGPHKGVFTFTNGTVDVNTLIIGNQSLETGTSTASSLGIFNVVGGGALLKVNTLATLGTATLSTGAGPKTYGLLNITNGTVYAKSIAVGTYSVSNVINLVNGTLIVSNTVATNAAGLFALNVSNSTIGLTVPANGSLRGLVQTLSTAGSTNLIQLDAAPVFFSSYPQQFPLIKYTTWKGANTFGLTNLPAWAVGATLVSNGPNASLDLSLPADPRPLITSQPTPYSGNPGDTVSNSLAVTLATASVTPLSYQWYYTNSGSTVLLTNGSGLSGSSTLSGATAANLLIVNAQPGDNGGYFVVITNAYGTNTSTRVQLVISASAVAPTASGPATQTATNGITTIIAASSSGSPVPTLSWQYNGAPLADGTGPSGSSTISGSATATLTLANPQYPGDQGTYSLIASNSAGLATNTTALTVIVPPTLTSQPVSLIVTNSQSASFTVGATGVPAPTYQWSKNGTPISSATNSSATNATFTIAPTSASDNATYSVIISNPAGSTTSATVTLTVNSVGLMPAGLSPTNGQTNVCYDTPLYLNFSQTPTLRAAGKIRIYNVTNAATPVDTIDLSLCVTNALIYAVNVQPYTIGGQTFTNFPVILTGNMAAIYPHHGLLTSNQTYYVTVDAGTFADSAEAYFVGITATNVWQFATKLTGPANSTNRIVAADGSGDFLTVQGAVDSVPLNNTTPTVINIRNGTYTELVNINSRNNLDLRGQSRSGVFIGYPNNNNVFGGAPWRSCFVLNGNDCTLETLTLTNMTAIGGGQAEAVDVEGTRAVFQNMELDSYQDTFLVHSAGKLVYFQDSLIQGQTDFNWGYGTVYYTNCELRCLISGGHVTQPRSPSTTNGFGFINCRITKGFSSGTFDLGRTISTPTSPSEVLFGNCLMDDAVTGYSSDAGTNMADYACSNLTAMAAKSLLYSTHSAGGDPYVIALQSAATWLYGWSPALAPNILTNPVSQTINYGSNATFTVTATGIPAPTYQWQHAGTNLPAGTSATLTVASATSNDAGTYTVSVTTSAGSVTSSSATLTVNPPLNTAPVFTAPLSTTNLNAGVSLAVSCTATDSDTPAQTLTYSLVTGPSGAAVDSSTGNFTWRPSTALANSTNLVTVVVTDNGTPNLSATNTFTVTVNPVTAPTTAAAAYSGGQFSVSVGGQVGQDYYLQANTNLTGGSWTTVVVSNSPASLPVTLTDPDAGSSVMKFYRIAVGPPAP